MAATSDKGALRVLCFVDFFKMQKKTATAWKYFFMNHTVNSALHASHHQTKIVSGGALCVCVREKHKAW